MDGKLRFTYNDIHLLVEKSVPMINQFKPDYIIAIGTGGFIPARILRKHVKVPFYAVIVKLYDDVTDQMGQVPEKIQWLSDAQMASLHGKNVLIVDEVDDTRKTLAYCCREIKHAGPAKVGVFVVHNKNKKKDDKLDDDVIYMPGDTLPDKWIIYPWEADDIIDHDAKATAQYK
jgi:hypoxanthine phosphoribosyltransferase